MHVLTRVAIFDQAVGIDQLGKGSETLKNKSLLWLDFDSEEIKGEYFSLGIGARSYGLICPTHPSTRAVASKEISTVGTCKLIDQGKGMVEITNRYAFTIYRHWKSTWQLTSR